jgi:hypothetical protein
VSSHQTRDTVVEAVKVREAQTLHVLNSSGLPDWLRDAILEGVVTPSTNGMRVETEDGEQFARSTDWIALMPSGDIVPFRPGLFAQLFTEEGPQ